MYKFFKQMLAMAERVGTVEKLDLGEWLSGKNRIYISGKTEDGMAYELELIVECKKDDGDDRD